VNQETQNELADLFRDACLRVRHLTPNQTGALDLREVIEEEWSCFLRSIELKQTRMIKNPTKSEKLPDRA
jgi:hypothetical protein